MKHTIYDKKLNDVLVLYKKEYRENSNGFDTCVWVEYATVNAYVQFEQMILRGDSPHRKMVYTAMVEETPLIAMAEKIVWQKETFFLLNVPQSHHSGRIHLRLWRAV